MGIGIENQKGISQYDYSSSDTKKENSEKIDYNEFLRQKIEEMKEKLDNGDVEKKYQIGAQSLTDKEWNTMIKKFDKTQDVIKEAIKEETRKKKKKTEEKSLDMKELYKDKVNDIQIEKDVIEQKLLTEIMKK